MTTLSTIENAKFSVRRNMNFPRGIHLTSPKTMAKNDKYVANMAIGSRHPFKLLSICPGLRTFLYFCFVFLLLTDMVESCLLSKDETKLWQFEFLEEGLKIQKSAKIGLLISGFYLLKTRKGKSVQTFLS